MPAEPEQPPIQPTPPGEPRPDGKPRPRPTTPNTPKDETSSVSTMDTRGDDALKAGTPSRGEAPSTASTADKRRDDHPQTETLLKEEATEKEEEQSAESKKDVEETSTSAVAMSTTESSSPPSKTSKVSAQSKAKWQSDDLDCLKIDGVTQTGELQHLFLEDEVRARIMDAQPSRPIQVPEVLVNEIATSTCRQMVGIVEGLLDRLLLQKKDGVIREMVAKLHTEDITDTIVAGQDAVMKKELGSIIETQVTMQKEICENESKWEERFKVTDTMQRAHEDLEAKMQERHGKAEERVAAIESVLVPRGTFDEQLNAVRGELAGIQGILRTYQTDIAAVTSQVADLKKDAHETFATKTALASTACDLQDAVAKCEQQAASGLLELREVCASKIDVAEKHDRHENWLQKHDANSKAARDAQEAIALALAEFEKWVRETCVTNQALVTTVSELQSAMDAMRQTHDDHIDQLSKRKADVASTTDSFNDVDRRLKEMAASTADLASASGLNTEGLAALREHCDRDLVTKGRVDDLAAQLGAKISDIDSCSDNVRSVKSGLDADREKWRSLSCQQQRNNTDLGEALKTLRDMEEAGKARDEQIAKDGRRLVELDEMIRKRDEELALGLRVAKADQNDITGRC